jgi:DNA invertase Pin-like site-specific DNA recombinase
MIAAIYARKSTDQAGVGDKSGSVERQIAHARAYALCKGWTVADAHVYVDDRISGAEFGDRRPGLARLLNALKPRPPFQVLVMSEESRLGRESIEVAYALKAFVQAGVRVFLYLEDRERTIDSPTEKLLMNVAAFADELERERARQRTYDVLLRKAKALHVTGGKVFGYDNVEVAGADGRRLHVMRRINEDQAAVVRRICALCSEGQGFTRIAMALNEDGVVSPRHASGWAPTAVREILLRPLYRGEVIWNRKQKRDRWGRARHRSGPRASGSSWRRPSCGSSPRRRGRPRIGVWSGRARCTRHRGPAPARSRDHPAHVAPPAERVPLERPGQVRRVRRLAVCVHSGHEGRRAPEALRLHVSLQTRPEGVPQPRPHPAGAPRPRRARRDR